jgi:hypothetical protein
MKRALAPLLNRNRLCTYNELPGQVDPGRHVVHVFNHLHAGSRLEREHFQNGGTVSCAQCFHLGPHLYLEHKDDVALVEYVARRVYSDPGEVLDLLGIPAYAGS